MGTFLAISSVIGKTKSEVVNSLTNYAKSVNGGLHHEENRNINTVNACTIEEQNGNTSILYPDSYLEWDNSSAFISKELQATVFSFHVHDGDLWMYVLYSAGEIVDQFNPIPDYWDDSLSNEEMDSWKGNAEKIAQLVPFINSSDIDKYLVQWDLDEEDPSKAYPTDKFTKEDWQLIDFMAKVKLPYPMDDNGTPKGQTYKIWTSQLELVKLQSHPDLKQAMNNQKPWWKFW